MGFSLSGSFALLLLAFFITAGMIIPTAATSLEGIRDAYRSSNDQSLHQGNSGIEITNATWVDPSVVDGDEYLAVNATNDGTTTLRVSNTDLLTDSVYQSDFSVREVEGDPDTDLWQPGERLYFESNSSTLDTNPLDPGDAPSRVKIVSDFGVSDTGEVAS